ncbi:helix-turn-helix domain-containing protein [Rhizobium sp. RHZ02]|uniref:helix-turn-helix transcriptional regulator n=1 Tax=Rhizobium sp. RHZ02 TaxID=2769306 RepID=UPI00178066F0|nr:helix-turn-helix domain-containing protein [Rhizobium sp. RHZ02]MBD9452201.1 helix-turn-helix domain-containing protein [Rhizobium sp. RHZ02]
MLEAQTILERLQKLAAKDNRPRALPEVAEQFSTLCTFVTRERERIAGCAFPRASIVVIVEGSKELVTMGRQMRFGAGTVLVLPGGWRGDVVNDPDPTSGVYRAIFIGFPDELVARAARSFPPPRAVRPIDLPLDTVLAAAIHHAGEGLTSGTLPALLIEHRVMEVLTVLGMRGVLPVKSKTTSDAVRSLIRWQPDKSWTAHAIAAELGTSNATLRRRLTAESTSLRDLLTEVRVDLAATLLSEEGVSLREAALAAGYRSPRRFAERMRARQHVANV